MAGRVNMEILMKKKEQSTERLMDKKEMSIEFSNSLNNAVGVWKTLAEHPEIKMDDALREIMDLVTFFGELKNIFKTEKKAPTPEEATQMVQQTFPGSEKVNPPQPKSGDITDRQKGMINAILNRLKLEGEARNKQVSGILNRETTVDSLSKDDASTVIKMLLEMEKK